MTTCALKCTLTKNTDPWLPPPILFSPPPIDGDPQRHGRSPQRASSTIQRGTVKAPPYTSGARCLNDVHVLNYSSSCARRCALCIVCSFYLGISRVCIAQLGF